MGLFSKRFRSKPNRPQFRARGEHIVRAQAGLARTGEEASAEPAAAAMPALAVPAQKLEMAVHAAPIGVPLKPVPAVIEPERALVAAEGVRLPSIEGGKIQLGLAAIFAGLPPSVISGPLKPADDSVRVALPLEPIASQLPSGRVEMPLNDFIAALPSEYRDGLLPNPSAKIEIPLTEVFQNLPGSYRADAAEEDLVRQIEHLQLANARAKANAQALKREREELLARLGELEATPDTKLTELRQREIEMQAWADTAHAEMTRQIEAMARDRDEAFAERDRAMAQFEQFRKAQQKQLGALGQQAALIGAGKEQAVSQGADRKKIEELARERDRAMRERDEALKSLKGRKEEVAQHLESVMQQRMNLLREKEELSSQLAEAREMNRRQLEVLTSDFNTKCDILGQERDFAAKEKKNEVATRLARLEEEHKKQSEAALRSREELAREREQIGAQLSQLRAELTKAQKEKDEIASKGALVGDQQGKQTEALGQALAEKEQLAAQLTQLRENGAKAAKERKRRRRSTRCWKRTQEADRRLEAGAGRRNNSPRS